VKTHAAQVTRRQILMGAGGTTLAVVLTSAGFGLADSASVRPLTWADFAGCALLDGANPFWMQAAEEIMAEQAARADGFK
jgi:hypothetical protein